MGYYEDYALSRGEDPDDIRREAAMEAEQERKGAAYSVKATRSGGTDPEPQAPHHSKPIKKDKNAVRSSNANWLNEMMSKHGHGGI